MKLVTIGASAGGVESLKRLCRGLDPDINAAFCVVMHLHPDSGSMLAEILDRACPLRVARAEEGAPLERGRVYVAPPNSHLLVETGFLRLDPGPRENGFRPAVDPTFRSAARAYGADVIGVVLSGALDDGTAGLKTIKRAGGTAVVQDPADAFYPTMPQSALEHVQVDYCARLDDIPALLFRLAYPAFRAPGPGDDAMTQGQRRRSRLTCPECSGALTEIEDGDVLQYRCHVGHAYTEQAMFAQHTQTVERALWTAVRILEERAMPARRLSERAHGRDQTLAARPFEERAADAERDADAIRAVIGATSADDVTVDGDRRKEEVAE